MGGGSIFGQGDKTKLKEVQVEFKHVVKVEKEKYKQKLSKNLLKITWKHGLGRNVTYGWLVIQNIPA